MTTDPPPPLSDPRNSGKAGAALAALLARVDDIAESVADRVEQLKQEILTLPHAQPPDQHLQRQVDALQLEKQNWEATRHREARRLREQADQLTTAWLNLEAEQRRLLQIRQSPATVPGELAAPPARPQSGAGHLPAVRSRQAAIGQFHRLRTEIGASRAAP